MSQDEYEELRSDLRKIVGRDYIYATAGEAQRHFDPITIVAAYAVTLFGVFIAGAVTKLGEKTGEAIWRQVSECLPKITNDHTPADRATQVQRLQQTDDALSKLGTTLSSHYLNEFIEAGSRCIQQRLISDNFPEAKATRISEEFARVIRRRVKP